MFRLVRGRFREERGSEAIAAAILTPALLLLLALIIAAGRLQAAAGSVETAARDAARAASIARTAGQAQADAAATAHASLVDQGLSCATTTVTTNTAGFGAPLGTSATVSVDVSCRLSLADVALPGVPGTVDKVAHFTSPLDPYRAR